MNKYYLLLVGTVFCISGSIAQDREAFNEQFSPVDTELKNWDPVRGAWLSESMNAIAHNERPPIRNFPENLTPYQMMSQVPRPVQERIENHINTASSSASENDRETWNRVGNFVQVQSCSRVSGRTYGDPHLVSFDGARYSFQTVGEFNFAKNDNGNVEVQTRQKPQSESFSLNTAVAMNVGGDRVCIYASDYPDNDYSSPVRVNGQVVNAKSNVYFLDNGGTVRFEGNSYVVDWPTGESLTARISSSSGMGFMDLNMHIIPCNGSYSGLMGNANNDQRDDFNTSAGVAPIRMLPGSGSTFERARQEYLSKEFAEVHRITQAESLFDYAPGQSTYTFTDRSFPRYYPNLDDLSDDQRNRARQNCQNSGVSSLDMDGCVYDNAYLNLPPSKPTFVSSPTEGLVMKPVVEPRPNHNPPVQEAEVGKTPMETGPQPIQTIVEDGDRETVPSSKEPIEIRDERDQTTPTKPTESRPIYEPRDTPKPSIESKPAPKPTIPRTAPKPSTPRPSAPRPSAPKPSAPKPSIKGRG